MCYCLISISTIKMLHLFIYLGFYVAFNTVQVISRWVVGRAEETSTYSLSGFCTVNCRPTASNYQLSHLKPCREPNPASGWEARVLPLCHCGPHQDVTVFGCNLQRLTPPPPPPPEVKQKKQTSKVKIVNNFKINKIDEEKTTYIYLQDLHNFFFQKVLNLMHSITLKLI